MQRREFVASALVTIGGIAAVPQRASAAPEDALENIVFTKEQPGHWKDVEALHVPIVSIKGDKMMVRDEQKENKINVRSNKLFQQVNRIVIDCVQGTILDSKDFSVKVFEDDKTFLMEMTPSSKGLREFFETIVLTVEKKDYSVKSIKMNEPLGDTTTIFFTNKKLNEPVSDAVFTL